MDKVWTSKKAFSHGAEVDVLICTRPFSSFLLAAYEVEWTVDATTGWSHRVELLEKEAS